MGKSTRIAWTRSTRNFWEGCSKVSPGCDFCYAESFSRFTRGKNEATGQATNWGPGAPRIEHLFNADRDVRKWNRACTRERTIWHRDHSYTPKDGWPRPGFWPVFINSHADTFDNEVPQDWRDLLFTTIEDCEALTFYLVTKRIGNVAGMVPSRWVKAGFPVHVRLLITVVNQEEFDRDILKLLALPCNHGLSLEPALGPIDLVAKCPPHYAPHLRADRIGWVIWGAESGPHSRPANEEWALSAARQCKDAGVPFFCKQLFRYRKEVPFDEYPPELQVREFPE